MSINPKSVIRKNFLSFSNDRFSFMLIVYAVEAEAAKPHAAAKDN